MKLVTPPSNANSKLSDDIPRIPSRVSFADPSKPIRRKRSLSTRGRISIAVDLKKDKKRKGKPPAISKGKNVKPPNFDKQVLYFQKVDAFELIEESPSPKKVDTWIAGNNMEEVPLPSLCPRLERWLHSTRLNPRCGPSSTLSKILDTPTTNLGVIHNIHFSSLDLRLRSLNQRELSISQLSNLKSGESKTSLNNASLIESEGCEDIEAGGDKLSLTSTSSSIYGDHNNPFSVLLEICGQSAPSMLQDLFSSYSGSETVVKVGEGIYGTYGEAFKVGNCVCKIVPFDGDLRVNGEVQKCYMVFVQQHGGNDLESFVLLNFDEARTLLVQVAAGLAVAESAYEFEHEILHWGNILVSRGDDSATLQFTLDGKNLLVETYGLIISIIDFTLSRMNTGHSILYLDLSADPDLFKGPKGDNQSETYRKMKKVTEDWWEGSFPKTNVLWLVYLVDILLKKKTFERTSKDERDLRSLKKRLDKYNSAKEAVFDPFFTDLFVESNPMA